MSGISLVSVNVERGKHLDTVTSFLERTRPDVVCIQECRKCDIPRFRADSGAEGFFYEPMVAALKRPESETEGIAILSRYPMSDRRADYYVGTPHTLPDSDDVDEATFNDTNRLVLSCEILKDGEVFRVATTHFTWSVRGQATDVQRTDMKGLLRILDGFPELVLTGDFNAPRGGEMFSILADAYKDNIPPEYETSIDIALHRAGKERPEELKDKMVDGLFSTKEYAVSDVRLESGVSDHCAVVAKVGRA
ncbi:endonuclease/exonuclease/phosphatase family protein [Candidatus Kaiserbacteria bacterium]|nr:endonuclease/exonuclease/phosphatase family protein [Candidatus Kaiserbacteria bacterium]